MKCVYNGFAIIRKLKYIFWDSSLSSITCHSIWSFWTVYFIISHKTLSFVSIVRKGVVFTNNSEEDIKCLLFYSPEAQTVKIVSPMVTFIKILEASFVSFSTRYSWSVNFIKFIVSSTKYNNDTNVSTLYCSTIANMELHERQTKDVHCVKPC